MPRILVIDDEAAIRGLLRVLLERAGYDVVDAANGQEGLCIYGAAPTALVITDLVMPGLEGLEVIRALHRAVPPALVIAISGDPQALTSARLLTPYTFAKPLPLRQVLATVQALVATPHG